MITREDILEIIHIRDARFNNWIKKNPQKLSLLKLKNAYRDWFKEVKNAIKFSEENDPKLPKEDLGFVYTFMNEFSAYRAHHTVAIIYIKKLEAELLKLNKKPP